MKLDEVSNAINDYREIHNNYVDVVNGNTETNSDGLDFSVGIQFKNDKLKQGIYTEPIDELILKLNKIY